MLLQIKVPKCCQPENLSALAISAALARWKLPHSCRIFYLFFPQCFCEIYQQIKRQLWDCHLRALLGQGWMKRYACWFYIYQHKHPVRDYFCLHVQPPFNSHSYARSHHFAFIYFPFLLLLKVLEQCSYFNVNSGYADVALNSPLSFHTAFPQNPWGKKNKIRETCICL